MLVKTTLYDESIKPNVHENYMNIEKKRKNKQTMK